jgi:hypothetical protein
MVPPVLMTTRRAMPDIMPGQLVRRSGASR